MKKILIINFCLFILVSCNQSNIYTNYFSFSDNIWHSDSSIIFDFNSRDNKSLNFNLIISYSNNYPFQNIYTSYSLLDSSKNILKSDMIELELFEKKYGYPLGDGILKDFTVDTLIINSFGVKRNANYKLLVKHSMREIQLKGINRIALEIEK